MKTVVKKAFLVETETSVYANFVKKEFNYPSIDEYQGSITINVPASGDLPIKEIEKFISTVEAAKLNAKQAEKLMKNYVF